MTIRWQESDLRGYQPGRGFVATRPGALKAAGAGVITEMSPNRLCVTLPVRLRSIVNVGAHPLQEWRRAKEQKAAVRALIQPFMLPRLPAVITITRLGPKKYDTDNNVISAKRIRDEIASMYGVDDGSDLYEWRVEQELAKAYGVRIEVERV